MPLSLTRSRTPENGHEVAGGDGGVFEGQPIILETRCDDRIHGREIRPHDLVAPLTGEFNDPAAEKAIGDIMINEEKDVRRSAYRRTPMSQAFSLPVLDGLRGTVRNPIEPNQLPSAGIQTEVRADRFQPLGVVPAVCRQVDGDEAARRRRQAGGRGDGRRRAARRRDRASLADRVVEMEPRGDEVKPKGGGCVVDRRLQFRWLRSRRAEQALRVAS
jgi:hypothetical protein